MSETELNAADSTGVSGLSAMKQALEALEYIHTETTEDEDELIHPAITALRLAIEQAEKQEPVAWGLPSYSSGHIIDCITPEEHAREPGGYTVPLYTAPPQRQPLRDETIERLMPEPTVLSANVVRWDRKGMHAFARAIKRAHGIGGVE